MRICTIALVAVLILNTLAIAAEPNPRAVPTFECLGIYYQVESDNPGECAVRYRVKGTGNWREGLPLWFDNRTGSSGAAWWGLLPGTEYEISLTGLNSKEVVFRAATRTDSFPAGKSYGAGPRRHGFHACNHRKRRAGSLARDRPGRGSARR